MSINPIDSVILIFMIAAVSVCGTTLLMSDARDDYRPQGRLVALGAFFLTLTIVASLWRS
jgi:hypothetical protein